MINVTNINESHVPLCIAGIIRLNLSTKSYVEMLDSIDDKFFSDIYQLQRNPFGLHI